MPFTPVESSVGGLLIGLSAALAYRVDGKIAGISGILGPSLRSLLTCKKIEGPLLWKYLFLIGLVSGGVVALLTNRNFSYPDAVKFSPLRYASAGLLVGSGTRAGRGCTSGHGICGLPRFSLRSWIAVPTFMGVAVLETTLLRHVKPFKVDDEKDWGIAELQWPPKWQFPLGAAIVAAVLATVTLLLPQKGRAFMSPLSCGVIFGLGLACSGMTSQAKVLDFLDVAGTWDPSLAFVMGAGLCANFPVMFWSEWRACAKPLSGEFEKPSKYGDYGMLVIGAGMFGMGWGLVGICPGPALTGFIPYAVTGWGSGLSFCLFFIVLCAAWLVTDKMLQTLATKTLPSAEETSVAPNAVQTKSGAGEEEEDKQESAPSMVVVLVAP